MSGILSKGGTPLTPAQQQLQGVALQNAQNYEKTWLPVQGFFASKVKQDDPALKAMGRGAAAGTVRAQGSDALDSVLGKDMATGAGQGSGKYLMDLGAGLDATAAGTGSALTEATAAGEKHYVMGLQDIVGMGQQSQGVAQQGLATAANEQAQEAGAAQQQNAQTQQGAGQLVGIGLAAMS